MNATTDDDTPAQRRARKRIEMVRGLEIKTREVVEAEQQLARLRTELVLLRGQLLVAVGGPRRTPAVPERVLAAARVVAAGATTADEVATALGVTAACARRRLQRALDAHLVDRTERGRYASPLPTDSEVPTP